MYDLHQKIVIAGGSASMLPNNVTVFENEMNNLTYAAVSNRYQTNTVSWDSKVEGMANDTVNSRHPTTSKPMVVLQVKYCILTSRTLPLMVVCSTGGVSIYDWNGTPMLSWVTVGDKATDNQCYTKGIASMSNYICVGCHTGEILVFSVRETSVKAKPSIEKHKCGISDLASDCMNAMASVDALGTIITFDEALKVSTKITTRHTIICIGVLNGVVIGGTSEGQLLVYDTSNGCLLAQVSAHGRAVNAIDTNTYTKSVISVSEDSFIRMWSIPERKTKDDIIIDCTFSESIENAMLVGAQFIDGRGSQFVVTAFDHPTLFYYKQKKTKSKSKS